ncbi:maleate cis-trans isomerase family protein [Paracraurococcus lichenis]|uniref:Aspartate/glutamate racemase family protein n=1 Tax=Paracraurococcus lichenis TaxID=3064888 RepID=A0ABT9DS65_9PROT|nr:aspartate/glutamate racemase family protein [Paracraurococcus sp. LOR1-02]MDO9706736.1 aspartate/glutamate racemase family protein [Paracraurococcus sp. LOR1-02]
MTHALRLGMLTPSSNTVLEPLTAAMLAGTPGMTAHFARFRVVAIDLGEGSRAQFDLSPVLAAAELLADAKVQAICWNGTSGSWLGLQQDRALCGAITARTGIPATTATLALMRAFAALGARRIGLVTPYLAEVQQAIAARWAEEGLDCIAERHLEDPGNFSFAEHAEATVARLVREVAAARPEAIAIHCTNFRGGRIAPELEAELGIPVLDSVAVSLWGAIGAAGGDAAPLARQGRVFALPW